MQGCKKANTFIIFIKKKGIGYKAVCFSVNIESFDNVYFWLKQLNWKMKHQMNI